LTFLCFAVLGALAPARGQDTRPPGAPMGTWAFIYPHHAATTPAALDLRSLNEKEAGQTGFIQRTADGNGFALGDGTPVRFWAVGTDLFRSSPRDMAQHAQFLAGIGVNLVRLHTNIAPKAKGSRIDAFDQEEIDHIWRFVAAARKEGIY